MSTQVTVHTVAEEKVPFYPQIGLPTILVWALCLGAGVAYHAYDRTIGNFELALHYFCTLTIVCSIVSSTLALIVLMNNRDPTTVSTVYVITTLIGTLVSFIWAGITSFEVSGFNDRNIAYTFEGSFLYTLPAFGAAFCVFVLIFLIYMRVKHDVGLSKYTG